jgi:hypothetical protein
VNEAEWPVCTDPARMLSFLHGRASDRKLRLFGVACCRRVWHLLADERCRNMVEVAERYADGAASRNDLREAIDQAWAAGMESRPQTNDDMRALACIMAGAKDLHRAASEAMFYASRAALGLGEADDLVSGPELTAQATLVRDICGNPFQDLRPMSRAWLTWKDCTIPQMARAIYDERAFDRLPILSDALEEAGCTNQDVLGHLRGPGPHCRGCWPLDLLLGKS